jgi:hypothetical protein
MSEPIGSDSFGELRSTGAWRVAYQQGPRKRIASNEWGEHRGHPLWRKKDPLDRLKKRVFEAGLMTDEADAALEAELTEQINVAVNLVEAMPAPERASLFDDVYAELPWHLVEEREVLEKTPRTHHKKPSESGT